MESIRKYLKFSDENPRKLLFKIKSYVLNVSIEPRIKLKGRTLALHVCGPGFNP